MTKQAQGPLAGIRIVEVGSIGPAPLCRTLLTDLGAEVVRIDRPAGHDGGASTSASPPTKRASTARPWVCWASTNKRCPPSTTRPAGR